MTPANFIDLTGIRFGRWLVIRRGARIAAGHVLWVCRCDCGVEREIAATSLRRGLSGSCGCLRREVTIRRSTRHGCSPRGRWTPEYRTWAAMWTRCTNPRLKDWPLYGGRGIAVDDRWRTFEAFLADMGLRPGRGYSIDRIDTEKGYAPENCRWATASEQARNRRPRKKAA